MQEMTPELAIGLGGWDPRYAVVLAMVVHDDLAAVLVDPNGDGGSIDLDEYRREDDGRWVAGNSGGSAGDTGESWSPWMVVAYGRAVPGTEILVDYGAETAAVAAGADGWWLFMTRPLDDETLPSSRPAPPPRNRRMRWRSPVAPALVALSSGCSNHAAAELPSMSATIARIWRRTRRTPARRPGRDGPARR